MAEKSGKVKSVKVDKESDKKATEPGGAGSNIYAHPIVVGKISKIILNPSRKINLGNYETVDLNAGLEIVFDTPVAFDSEEVKQAFTDARKVIREEFAMQYKPYLKVKKA